MKPLCDRPSRRERRQEKQHLLWSRYWVNLQCLLVLTALAAVFCGGFFLLFSPASGGGNSSGSRPGQVLAFLSAGWFADGEDVVLAGGPLPRGDWLRLPQPSRSLLPGRTDRSRLAADGTGRIQVDLPSRTLTFWREGKCIREYPVAIGSPATPTPLGSYQIIQKERDPWWYPPMRLRQRGAAITPSGPANPLGYRWLGFGNAYGIHGTNAPWYIGAAVSNGCIRMRENDVEELFEEVDLTTPLEITYDPVRVGINGQGEAEATVYPDIYGYRGYGGLGEELRRQLSEQGLDGLASEALCQRLVREQNGRPAVLGRVAVLKVNGVTSPRRVLFAGSEPLAPLWGVATALQFDVQWDGQKKEARCGNRTVPGMDLAGSVYLTPQAVQRLFDGFWLWRPAEQCLEFTIPVLNQRYQPGRSLTGVSPEPASAPPVPPGSLSGRAANALLPH